ncbi:MAG TPA: VOC family protein [Chthonomonadaceae bacterium]|nr:VOC family protein [Chthonomonadaceae bacterium]
MSDVTFEKVSPIGDTNIRALPVCALGPAIAYYTRVLGFTVVVKTDKSAVLSRDSAEIVLEVNDADPGQASCYFAVSDVEALHAEYSAMGIEPSPLRIDDYGGKRIQVFFAKEPYGVCFCFGQEISE